MSSFNHTVASAAMRSKEKCMPAISKNHVDTIKARRVLPRQGCHSLRYSWQGALQMRCRLLSGSTCTYCLPCQCHDAPVLCVVYALHSSLAANTSTWWAPSQAMCSSAAQHTIATTWAPLQDTACLCMLSSGTACTQTCSCPAVQTGASR
jgi:hypothetical protein